jgi:hypothetical protein
VSFTQALGSRRYSAALLGRIVGKTRPVTLFAAGQGALGLLRWRRSGSSLLPPK